MITSLFKYFLTGLIIVGIGTSVTLIIVTPCIYYPNVALPILGVVTVILFCIFIGKVADMTKP